MLKLISDRKINCKSPCLFCLILKKCLLVHLIYSSIYQPTINLALQTICFCLCPFSQAMQRNQSHTAIFTKNIKIRISALATLDNKKAVADRYARNSSLCIRSCVILLGY